ncbi:MAG: AAA family ATPase [Lachnospiraceae bacterium]|nr:AAA family ATPase [Lachnospiraceae bacterium]
MKKVYLIGGTMGVGKTTVCRRLQMDLPRSVFLDGDWCWDAHPFQVTEETKAMVLDNISHLLNNFIHCSAYENIIFCWVMQEQSIVDAVRNRLELSDCDVISVSLLAAPETVRERLLSDIRNGIRTDDVIERSLSRIPQYAALDTRKVETDGKTVEEISQEIRAL